VVRQLGRRAHRHVVNSGRGWGRRALPLNGKRKG
jgi:hypothetical protein